VPEFYIGWGIVDDISGITPDPNSAIRLHRAGNKFDIRTQLQDGPASIWLLVDLLSKSTHHPDTLGLEHAAEAFSYQVLAGYHVEMVRHRVGIDPLIGVGLRNEKAHSFTDDSDRDLVVYKQHNRGPILGARLDAFIIKQMLVRAIFRYDAFDSPVRQLNIEIFSGEESVRSFKPSGGAALLGMGLHCNWLGGGRVERVWYIGLAFLVPL
jgi:hypothetical protein